MGHTYRKEKTVDDYGNNRKHKRAAFQEIDRKEFKNKNFSQYYQEEFDDDEFEDEYDDDFDDSIDDFEEEKNNNFTKNRK